MQEPRVGQVTVGDMVRFGYDRGVERGLRDAVLVLLSARGLVPSPEQRDRLEAERDVENLRRWVVCASAAASIGALLES
jgi:hypothetical protein